MTGNRHACPHCGGSLITKKDEHPLARMLGASSHDATKTYAMSPSFVGTGADDLTRVDEPRHPPDNGNALATLTTPGSYREDAEEIPVHAASLRSQWATPTLKTITVWVGYSAVSFAFMVYTSSLTGLNIPRPGVLAFLVGCYPSKRQWFKDEEYFNNALYKMRTVTEKILQVDLNNDGIIGEPKRPDPGTVIINGRQVPQESAASKKRRAMAALAEIVWKKQNAGLKTGVKELMAGGNRLPGGYKIGYDLHKEVGRAMVQGGYAEHTQVGQNTTWRFLEDVQLEELSAAIGVWDDS